MSSLAKWGKPPKRARLGSLADLEMEADLPDGFGSMNEMFERWPIWAFETATSGEYRDQALKNLAWWAQNQSSWYSFYAGKGTDATSTRHFGRVFQLKGLVAEGVLNMRHVHASEQWKPCIQVLCHMHSGGERFTNMCLANPWTGIIRKW